MSGGTFPSWWVAEQRAKEGPTSAQLKLAAEVAAQLAPALENMKATPGRDGDAASHRAQV